MLSAMEEIRNPVIWLAMLLEDLDHWMERYHLSESSNPVIMGPTDSITALPLRKVTLNEEIF